MITQRAKSPLGWQLALSALLTASALVAQTTTTPATPAKAATGKDEVLVLSPFEVNTGDDKGYVASGTLAGTRLRQDLRDVAASVSVITKDFMNDIGANNLEQLMTYTTGTEVNGLGGNMSGADISSTNTDFDQINRQPTSTVRIRGIGSGTTGADQARDYYTSDIPTDSFNLDRVEVMRGPNAMLFGLGAPSGIVNSTLIKAKLQKDATSVELKFGRYGTYRAELDHNEMLIKDKLGFRFALVGGTTKYMQEPAYDQNRRAYGTLTYKPFSDTTIKISGEAGRRESNKPQMRPPNDAISWWFRSGKPIYDPTTSRLSFLGTPPDVTSPIFPGSLTNGVFNGGRNTTLIGQLNGAIMVVNEDPNVRYLGVTGYKERGIIAYELGSNDRLHVNTLTTPNATNPLVGDGMANIGNAREYLRRYATNSTSATNNLTWNFWRTPQMTDASVYDFYTQMIEGPNKWEDAKWDTFNATIEQRLGKNAGFEVSADWQNLNAAYSNPSNQVINVDINTKLPDGMVNPNFGRPFTSAVGWASSEVRERKGARATAYYELDLRDNSRAWLGKLLGQHIITGNVSSAEYFVENFGGRPWYSGLDYYDAEQASNAGTTAVINKTVTNDKRAIWQTNYMGPSLVNSTDGRNAGIQNTRVNTSIDGLPTILTHYYQSPVINSQAPAQWKDVAFTQLLGNTRFDNRNGTGHYSLQRRSSESLSKAIILNSRLFEDSLITTLGWRSDDFTAYDAGAAPTDANTGLKLSDYTNWPLKKVLDTTIDTFNYGIVWHIPRSLQSKLPLGMDFSLTYNKSDNTSPTSPRFNSKNGGTIPAPTGSTEEFGARLGLFDGKLELRVVKFETAASYASNFALRGPQNNLVRATETVFRNIAQGSSGRIYSEAQPRDQNLPPTPDAVIAQKAWNDYFATPTGKDYLNAYLFTGVGTAQITHDDRVDVVVSTSDIVSTGYDFEVIYNPTKNWRISANGTNATAIRTNTAIDLNSMADEFDTLMAGAAGNLPNGNNSTQALRDNFQGILVDIRKERDLDGSASPEERQWRANFITNYTFTQGRMKNVRIGGAVRWQDKIAIGYPVVNRPTGVVAFNPVNDVSNPYYAGGETNYDAWAGYSRKFKHFNWSIQLNVKNIGVDKALIPVSAQPDGTVAAYRIAEPMTWSLSNTFDF